MKQVNLPGHQPKDCLPIQIPGPSARRSLRWERSRTRTTGTTRENRSGWRKRRVVLKDVHAGVEQKGKWIDLVFEGASFQGEVWFERGTRWRAEGMLNPRAFDGLRGAEIRRGEYDRGPVGGHSGRTNQFDGARLTWDTPRDQLYSIAQCMYGWDGDRTEYRWSLKPVRLRVSGPIRNRSPVYHLAHFTSAAEAGFTVDLDVAQSLEQPETGVDPRHHSRKGIR